MARTLTQAVLTLTVVFIAFIGGFRLGVTTDNPRTIEALAGDTVPARTDVDLSPLWKTWAILDSRFVAGSSSAAVGTQDHVWGLVSGLVDSYGDPYTTFMPPLENEGFKLEISGSFGGIGVEIGMRNDFLTVIAPLKGSPAEQAGLRSGDIIVAIDDHQTQSMSIDESVHFIRGEVGTQVNLTVAREGEQEFRTITVTRDTVNVPTIDTTWNNDVFIVALYNFGGTAVSEMRRALREFVAADGTHLVIDLRGNTGGYLEAAVDIASWFLPAGTEVVREDWGRGKDPVVRRAAGKDVSDGRWRIAVLVDGGTASAAEILAAALRERRGAVLIGEQTFGKGSVQELVEITPETSLKVTIARWLTPNGTSLSENGLTPDTVIPRTMEDVEAGRDPQLDAALRYVRTGVLEKSVSTSTVVQMEEKR